MAATLASVDSVISVVKMPALHHRGHREHRGDLPIGDGSFLPLYASHALTPRLGNSASFGGEGSDESRAIRSKRLHSGAFTRTD